MIEVKGGSTAAAPKGTMTYDFTHEKISLPPSSGRDLSFWAEEGLREGFWALKLDFVLEARILACC